MVDSRGRTDRPLRADARRNRARVLEAAQEVFGEQGLTAPIDEIAHRAGVGMGTVYRHFPTKEALFEAIVRERVGYLTELARSLADADDPGTAFFVFFGRMMKEGLAKKDFAAALASAGLDVQAATARAAIEFNRELARLLERAQRAGAVRADVGTADIKALMAGCLNADGSPDRLITVVCDGLRHQAG